MSVQSINYKQTYLRTVTQDQLPAKILGNIKTIEIVGTDLVFSFLEKNPITDKWQQMYGKIKLKNMSIPDYIEKYLRAVTQGRLKTDKLRVISRIHIVGNRLTYSIWEGGKPNHGAFKLEGMEKKE